MFRNSKEEALNDPIKHVVLLMMENHSFDQMLGSLQQKYPDLEGVNVAEPRFNLDAAGKENFQKETTEKQMRLDPLQFRRQQQCRLMSIKK